MEIGDINYVYGEGLRRALHVCMLTAVLKLYVYYPVIIDFSVPREYPRFWEYFIAYSRFT